MAPKKHLRLTLLENGLDFIREGVEALYGDCQEDRDRTHKYALLHVFSGTLLVLKERLRREHESLIFKDVAKNGRPDAYTVDFDEVIKRLEGAARVKLDDADSTLLRRVQGKRNAIEHYEANLDLEEVNTLIGELVEFLDRFLQNELKDSLFKHISGTAGQEVRELAKFAERRHKEWLKRAAAYRDLSDEQLDELADETDDQSLMECWSCGDYSVAVAHEDVGVCTNHECREVNMLEKCERCSRFAILGGGAWCDECSNYMQDVMDRDG